MKKVFSILVAVLLTVSVFAQSPQKMSYQAVIRNNSDQLVGNQAVGMQISILQGSASGTAVYVETQTPTTNANGLVSIEIGSGTIVSGNFATIDWATGPYFIKTETDLNSGTNYTITGTSQLLSVPYAMHAKTAETITGGITETDPVFVASPANGITNTNITNWNSAYGWGNHATAGYLTSFTETDPLFTASPSYGISGTNITNWNNAFGWGNHATAGYLTSFTETDPLFAVSPSYGISGTNITNWNNAFGWGNHATAGYLTSFTETDPLFTASPSYGISGTNITNWNNAFGWGNHATAGYLTNFTETDPLFAVSPSYGISGTNITNWNNAFGWGNHATAGYLTSFTETDPLFTASPSYGISGTNITNWNNAFGWGNHTTAGYLTSFTETDPLWSASPSYGITNTNITNWNTAYGWGNHATAGYLTSVDGSETKLSAGTNVTITGNGTTASPYVVNASATHYPGELYGGGVVFWVDQTGQHGLIVSMVDLSTSQAWSHVTSTVIGATAQSDWDGNSNTTAITAQSGHTSSAAKLCADYTNADYGTGTYTDWYLPSRGELNHLWNNLYEEQKALDSDGNSSTTAIAKYYYWSSSEYSSGSAWLFYFINGSANYSGKNNTYYVRAVRAF